MALCPLDALSMTLLASFLAALSFSLLSIHVRNGPGVTRQGSTAVNVLSAPSPSHWLTAHYIIIGANIVRRIDSLHILLFSLSFFRVKVACVVPIVQIVLINNREISNAYFMTSLVLKLHFVLVVTILQRSQLVSSRLFFFNVWHLIGKVHLVLIFIFVLFSHVVIGVNISFTIRTRHYVLFLELSPLKD